MIQDINNETIVDTESPLGKILNSENWELTSHSEKLFTSDHVINAYLAGKKEGATQEINLIMDKLNNNINLSGKYTNELIQKMKDIGIVTSNEYLKINSWDNFTILLIISETDFVNDNIFDAYRIIQNFEADKKSDFYSLTVSILDSDENYNEHLLISDGYNFKFKD